MWYKMGSCESGGGAEFVLVEFERKKKCQISLQMTDCRTAKILFIDQLDIKKSKSLGEICYK